MRLSGWRAAPPDTISTSEELPSLASFNAISHRPNQLTTGFPLQRGANYGFTSTMSPVEGWRSAPLLNAAAGPAPRDTHVPVYNSTPAGSVQAKNTRVAPTLLRATQQDALQFVAVAPVSYVPGGVATVATIGK